MKILTVVGARPQFVKAAALSRALKQHNEITEIIVHTGQHFDKSMSDVFFEEMEIPHPTYNLNINSLDHGAMTGRMIEGIEELLKKENPNILLVYGDTNSTIAGALAARKLHIPVAHVEAGLRSFNMQMPEEINRILTDRISNILFCPTDAAVSNLKAEGFENFDCELVRSGDVMQDAAIYYSEKSTSKSKVIDEIGESNFVLATVHRAENTDNLQNMKNLVESLNRINEQTTVVLPLHPRTKKILETNNLDLKVKLIDPVGYFDMIELLKHCKLVMTDSGGVQKEAFFFQKPCITLREQTEWVELVENGFNWIVGTDPEKIKQAYEEASNARLDFSVNLYGEGKASNNIATALIDFIGK